MSSGVPSIQPQFNIKTDNSNGGEIYEFERFRLDAIHLMLYEEERTIALAPKVVETLLALVERRGEIVSKEEMMTRVWKNAFVEESNLTQNIYLLRKTLGRGSDGRDLIETFRRRGYRFNGEIKNFAKVETENNDSEKNAPPNWSIEKSQADNFDSLAVLPIMNESRDETAEYLSDAITESVINRLSELGRLRVVGRNTAFRYKNREIEPQEIHRSLGVDAIFTGRILQFGERLIVRTELVDAASGWQIWGEQFERKRGDALELQETIAREISERLHLKLTGEELRRLVKRDTENSAAYDLYVKGRFFLNRRLTETIQTAAECFEQAIEIDPNYALAYVGLADCYPLLSLYGALAPAEAYPKAERAALKALEIDDAHAAAYNSLGVVKFFYEWNWEAAENAFRRAIELNPNYPDAHQRYGMFLTAVGRFDEAALEMEKAGQLDPLSPIIKVIGAYPFYYGRRFDEAASRFREVIAADENYSMAHFRLGLTFAAEQKYDEALREIEKALSISNDRDTIAALGFVQGLAGNRSAAEAALAELDEREKLGFVTSYNRALIKIGLGDSQAALDWLEKAYRERSYWLIYLKFDPSVDSLREDERFISLEKKIFSSINRNERGAVSEVQAASETPRSRKSSANKFLWFSVAAGLLILVLFAFSNYVWRDKNAARQNGRNANLSLKRLTPNLMTFNPIVSPDGNSIAFAKAEEQGTTSLWLQNIQTGKARQLLPPVIKGYLGLQFSPDGKQIYYLIRTPNRTTSIIAAVNVETLETREVIENVPVWFAISPDGNQIAFVRDTDLVVADANGSGEQRIILRRDGKSKWFASQTAQPAWSADGTRIFVSAGYLEQNVKRAELVEVTIADGAEKRIQTPPWDKIGSVAWAGENDSLYVIAREEPNQPSQIFLLSLQNGDRQWRKITSDLHNYNSLSVMAGSGFLIAEQAAGKSEIFLADRNNLKALKQITTDEEENTGVNGLAFMRDGSIVFTSPRSGNIDLWLVNSDGSNPRQLTANLGGWNIRPRPTADGRFIVFQSFYNNQNQIWRIDADGKNLIQLTSGNGSHGSPDVSPDGQWVYYNLETPERASVWKVSINGGEPILVSDDDKVVSPSISPDGKLMAFSYEWDPKAASKIGIMSLATGKIIKRFDAAAYRRILRWSPDSKSLIYIQKNSANLWQQAIDGGLPEQLTDFNLEQTWNFAYSFDNQQVALVRGSINTEAVLISNFDNLPFH